METIVFTNGCFDIIHPGHIDLLRQARLLGTKLIVGINSDRSVREIKGAPRPLTNQDSRALILSELRSVDEVRIFDETTPERLIRQIRPQVLVKGGDWLPDQIIGAAEVLKNGGRVVSIPFRQNISTTQIVEKISLAQTAAAEARGVCRESPADEFSLAVYQIFTEDELANIRRAANLIEKVLANNANIEFAATTAARRTADRLAEDLEACGGNNRIVAAKFPAAAEGSMQPGDLLIAVGDEGQSDELIAAIIQARGGGAKIIVLAGENARKPAALSDVCIRLTAESAADIFWQQSAVVYLWCLEIENRS